MNIKIILAILLLFLNCRKDENMNQIDFEVFVNIKWGDYKGEIHPVTNLQQSSFSFSPVDQSFMQIQPYIFKLNSRKEHALIVGKDNVINVFSISDKSIQTFRFDDIIKSSILDILYENNMFIILVQSENEKYSLFQIENNGKVCWQSEVTGIKCTELLFNSIDNIFLIGENSNLGEFHVINTKTGNTERIIKNKYYTKKVSVNKEYLYSVDYFPDKELRGITQRNLVSDDLVEKIMDSDNSLKLLYTIGMSGDNAIYTFLPASYDNAGISSISTDNVLLNEFSFTDLDVKDDVVYVLNSKSNSLCLSTYNIKTKLVEKFDLDSITKIFKGETVTIQDFESENQIILHANIDLEDKFYILNYKSGIIEEKKLAKGYTEKALQSYETWQIDYEGNVYIPIIKPEGFTVLKLTLK